MCSIYSNLNALHIDHDKTLNTLILSLSRENLSSIYNGNESASSRDLGFLTVIQAKKLGCDVVLYSV